MSQILAGVTGLVLVVMGLLEIFRHGDPRMYRLLLIKPADVPAVRMWAMNIGAYNIAFGLGIACGLLLVNGPSTLAGTAILLFCCASQFVLGLWLGVTERRLWPSAVGQAVIPGLVVLFWLILR